MTQALYEKMWTHEDYRKVAPGEHYAYRFVDWAKPPPASKIIDFGCGTGRGAFLIKTLTNSDVLALDFAQNALDKDIRPLLHFRQQDLREPIQETTRDFGYCTDVLEHIAPEDVEKVLQNIFVSAKNVFLAISTVPDHFGPAVAGEPLHLTVRPHEWWKTILEDLGVRIERHEEQPAVSFFYGSIYYTGEQFAKGSNLNVTMDRLRENITANLKHGAHEVVPHEAQDTHIYLLAGGPSLADHEDEIIQLGKEGALFVTVNGTYKWLVERGIKPAAQFVIDAREFNDRFVEPIIPTCKYIFSSQAAKEVVAKVPKEQTYLFHSGDTELLTDLLREARGEENKGWFPVYGGTTVVGRALVCLAMLGFRNIEVFGWDSCLRDDKHHAYDQKENDSEFVVNVNIHGRDFRCHPWMVVQAHEFPKIVRYLIGPLPDFNLCVRGDGLIAHMLNHAALLAGKD